MSMEQVFVSFFKNLFQSLLLSNYIQGAVSVQLISHIMNVVYMSCLDMVYICSWVPLIII